MNGPRTDAPADPHNRWIRHVLANRDSADDGTAETISAYTMKVSS